jgi:hypothetical protein
MHRKVKMETPAADELRATVERTRAEMKAAAMGAASSSAEPADLVDVTDAQLRAKRALDEAARASAIDITGSDEEAAPSGYAHTSSAPSGLPAQPGSASRSTSKKPRVSLLAKASTPSAAPSPANQPAGPLPAWASSLSELPVTCRNFKRGGVLEAPDRRYGYAPHGPHDLKTAMHAGHILLRLRATRPPTMLPKSGRFNPSLQHSLSHDCLGAVMDGLTLGLVDSEAGSAKTIALLGSVQRLTTVDHGNDGRSQLVRVNW